jgi:hypothetical protein
MYNGISERACLSGKTVTVITANTICGYYHTTKSETLCATFLMTRLKLSL